jgi:hypothetical protein
MIGHEMERLLMEIPSFRLWRKLTNSIKRARSRLAGSMPAEVALNRSWLGV